MKEITTKDLKDRLEKGEKLNVFDVRRDDEVAEGKIPGAKHIELDKIPDHMDAFDKTGENYLVCRSGGRSGRAGEFLEAKGYNVINVTGGMLAWEGDTE